MFISTPRPTQNYLLTIFINRDFDKKFNKKWLEWLVIIHFNIIIKYAKLILSDILRQLVDITFNVEFKPNEAMFYFDHLGTYAPKCTLCDFKSTSEQCAVSQRHPISLHALSHMWVRNRFANLKKQTAYRYISSQMQYLLWRAGESAWETADIVQS